ncbi:hypothetical protein BSL78_15068 [Apostichopus japonicus]|uniref:Uncharacterized protein n=1 Tax=Stichopus japonicus TaxID=307972 RepID=A0A2G8KJ80_STIJA|nr:hypothetical protein BSL78_15068 [Apostichopus japonicus]
MAAASLDGRQSLFRKMVTEIMQERGKVHPTVTKGPRLDIQPHLEVFRRDSKNLPSLGEPTVDWEETVYLNLILQQYTYTLTCGVCIKEEGTLTVLRKYSQQVYASPSRRQMDRKAEVSHMAYPFIFFMIDNFEEASVTSKVARKMSMGLYQEGRSRLEFIRMRGPESKGYAEVAVRQNAPSHESSFDDGRVRWAE